MESTVSTSPSASHPPGGSAPREWFAPLLLALAVFAFWLPGLDVLLPHQPEPDAYAARQIEVLEGREPPERTFFFYPLLLARLASTIPVDAGFLTVTGLEPELHQASAAWIRVRVISLLAHAATVLLVFALARRFLGARASLLASALMAVALVPATYVVQGRPHMLALATVSAGLLFAVRFVERPSLGRSVAVGLSLFLAGGTLHSGWMLIGSVMIAHLIAAVQGYGKGKAIGGAVLALVIGAAAVPLLYPTWSGIAPPVQGKPVAVPEISNGVLRWGQHRLSLGRFGGANPLLWLQRFWEWDPVLLVSAVAGLFGVLLGLRRWRSSGAQGRASLVLAVHGVAYVGVLCLYKKPTGRYLLSLYPVCAVLGAAAVRNVARRVRWGKQPLCTRRVALVVLTALVLWIPGSSAAHLWRLRQRPDTAELAAAWLTEKVVAGQPVGMASVTSLPFIFAPARFDQERTPWIRSQPWPRALVNHAALDVDQLPLGSVFNLSRHKDLPAIRAELDHLKGGFLVVEVSQRTKATGRSMKHLDRLLDRFGTLLETFSPSQDEEASQRFFDFGDAPDQRRFMMARDRLGPLIQIYGIPKTLKGRPGK